MSFKNGWDEEPIESICPDCELFDCECNDIAEANKEEEADRKRDMEKGL